MPDSVFISFFTLLNKVYKHSVAHKLFVKISCCFKESFTGKLIKRYLDRESSLSSSRIVRFFSRLWTRVTFFLRKANRCIGKLFKNGLIYKIFAVYIEEGKKDLANLVSYPAVGFIIGFYGYISMKHRLYKKNLIAIVLIGIVVFVGVKYRKEIIKWVKESGTFKIIRYFWE